MGFYLLRNNNILTMKKKNKKLDKTKKDDSQIPIQVRWARAQKLGEELFGKIDPKKIYY